MVQLGRGVGDERFGLVQVGMMDGWVLDGRIR